MMGTREEGRGIEGEETGTKDTLIFESKKFCNIAQQQKEKW